VNTLFFAAVVVISCVGAYQLAVYLARPSGGLPQAVPDHPANIEIGGLVVATADLDLGDVWEDRAFSVALPVMNRTAEPIHVLDFTTSCSCTSVEPRSLDIPAGERRDVRLTIDLTRRGPAEMGAPERTFQVEANPVIRGTPVARSGWPLHGVVHSRVTFDPLFLHFGASAVSDQPPPTRTVHARVHVPCRTLRAEVKPPLGTVEVSRVDGEQDRFDVRVAPLPSLAPGSFQFEVVVDVVSSDGEPLPGAVIPVAGAMQPEVRALPARLFLGAKPVGKEAEAEGVLQVPDGAEWVVDHIETDSPDLSVETAKAPGLPNRRAFLVRAQVTKEGDGKSLVRFFVRKPGRELTPLTMEVNFHGEQVEPARFPEGR
jgi:hypothetical protein